MKKLFYQDSPEKTGKHTISMRVVEIFGGDATATITTDI